MKTKDKEEKTIKISQGREESRQRETDCFQRSKN